MRLTLIILFVFACMIGFSASQNPAYAQEHLDMFSKERFQIRLRGIGVVPDESSTVNIGGSVDVGDAVAPEIDVTYFFTDKIGAELIAATTQHEVDYSNNTNLGKTWLLPPTLTLQYHPLRGQDFSPYVGAGLNYSIFYSEETGTGYNDLEIDGGFGYALQAGFDYWLSDHWGLNADVKKLWLDIDAKLNDGNIRADVDLDPWIIGAGVSYRF